METGWHNCRYEIVSVHPSGMISRAYIYARKANMITQVARFAPGDDRCGRYQVEDRTCGDYTADTLKDVMRIAEQREAARLAAQAPTRTRGGG